MIEIKKLNKSFGDNKVLQDIDLNVKAGEVVAIIGPSGTGKSTLLRCINFLEHPDSGKIKIDDMTIDTQKVSSKEIYALRAKSSMVFQTYNLFKNKTVLENILEPLIQVQKIEKDKAIEEAKAILKKVGMSDKENEYPSRLSGGQQQRAGIGRAIAVHSQVMLFDEPTSALDPELVSGVLELIKQLAEENITMLIVTHEMNFAKQVADKIVFMDNGRIAVCGTPKEVFEESTDERLIQFLNKVR